MISHFHPSPTFSAGAYSPPFVQVKGFNIKKIQSSSIVDLIKLYPLGENPRKGLKTQGP
jgi:hypothetical protein